MDIKKGVMKEGEEALQKDSGPISKMFYFSKFYKTAKALSEPCEEAMQMRVLN